MLGDIHALFAAEPQTKVEELLESWDARFLHLTALY
jgi:hypothetical protein